MTSVPISVQLYSLREEAARDFTSVLSSLGEIGFVGVELAGMNDLTAAELAVVLADCGLVVSSAHIGDVSPDALNRSFDDLQTVGCSIAVLPFLPPNAFPDLDAVQRHADAINAANDVAQTRGMRFGYHNHWWEFDTSLDGRPVWNQLVDRLDPAVLTEVDIYWATVGGHQPDEVITALGSRAALIHVKDGPADDPSSPMVAVGSGSVDIPRVLAAATFAEWHVVELDRCATDMLTAISDSYRYLVGSGLSAGRV